MPRPFLELLTADNQPVYIAADAVTAIIKRDENHTILHVGESNFIVKKKYYEIVDEFHKKNMMHLIKMVE